MFTLPQLPRAFNLLGDDQKLSFRTSPRGVRRLAEEKNLSLSDDEYWSQYITLFDTASDVFTLISPNDVYRAMLHQPDNVATLLRYLINKLATLLGDHTFPTPPPSISSSLNPLNSLPSSARNPSKEALNCVRVLSRVLPVLFGLEIGPWEEEILWKKEAIIPQSAPGVEGYAAQQTATEPQFVIEDEDDDDQVTTPMLPRTASQQSATARQPSQSQLGPSLAEKLINALIDLLFCCGFTMPLKSQIDHHKIQHIIWEKGVGSTFTQTVSSREQSYIDANRTEILRLLLILTSKQIYQSSSSIITTPSRYTHYLVQSVPRKLVLTTLCSLLNIVINSSSAQAPGTAAGGLTAGIAGVGKGISKGLGQLPYTQVLRGEDSRDGLISMAAQVLVVLLDYQSGSAKDIVSATSSSSPEGAPITQGAHGSASSSSGGLPPPTPSQSSIQISTGAPSPKSNHFRYFLSKVHRPADLSYLLEGLLAILGDEIRRGDSILGKGLGALQGVGVTGPNTRNGDYVLEVMTLLWKLLDINKKFRAYVVEGDRAVDVVAYILCYCLELKDKPKSHGICRALSYMIQSISAEPAFGPQLSAVPIRVALPNKWSIVGTSADFFVSSIYSIISNNSTNSGSQQNNSTTFSSLYPALVISIANCAPYLKNLSTAASNKLLQLLAGFADPRMLLADEGNPRLVYFMLDAFNSILYHHPSQNPHFLYSILRSHVLFEDLGTFTLARGLREIKRREEEEASNGQDGSANARGKKPAREGDLYSEHPHEEKARLLAAEGRSPHPDTDPGPLENTLLGGSLESLRIASPPPPGTSHWAEQEGITSSTGTLELSEKARGKMRQRTESLEGSLSIERAAAAAVGRNGFVPTQEWVTSWQQGLLLDGIMVAISDLLPKVQEIQSSMNRPSTSPAVLDFLRVVNLKPILPHRIPSTPRPFIWTESSLVWLTSLLWGDIYVKGMSPLCVWNGTNVRLFYVRHALPQSRQITETVSNVMGGILGRRDSATVPRA